jgi:hypothetical protein
MRFILVLALFSVPLVYAGLGNLSGISHLMEQQRLEKIAAGNTPAAEILEKATIPNSTKIDDNIGLSSSGSAVHVTDPTMSAFDNNTSTTIFANAQLIQANPAEKKLRQDSLIEDATVAKDLTGTNNNPNPEEIIGLGTPENHALLSNAQTSDKSKINIL